MRLARIKGEGFLEGENGVCFIVFVTVIIPFKVGIFGARIKNKNP